MTDEPEIKQKGRRSVTHLTKMFENKSTNDPKRRSVQNNNALKTARNEIKKLTSEQEESDDIFDDITLPNTNRNRASSILDKVKMFNQTDITQTEKILKNVSSLASTLLVINHKTQNETVNIEGPLTSRRAKSNIEEDSEKNDEGFKNEISTNSLKEDRSFSVKEIIYKIDPKKDSYQEMTQHIQEIKEAMENEDNKENNKEDNQEDNKEYNQSYDDKKSNESEECNDENLVNVENNGENISIIHETSEYEDNTTKRSKDINLNKLASSKLDVELNISVSQVGDMPFNMKFNKTPEKVNKAGYSDLKPIDTELKIKSSENNLNNSIFCTSRNNENILYSNNTLEMSQVIEIRDIDKAKKTNCVKRILSCFRKKF